MPKKLLAILFLIVLSSAAWAHSWYDSDCCSGRDCFEATSVFTQPNGDRLVTAVTGVVVVVPANFTAVRPSRDNNYHICYYVEGGKPVPRCFYVPGNS